MDIEELASCLRQTLGRRDEILLAYLFGSWARGRNHPLSDIDVAVWCRSESLGRLDRQTVWGYQAALIGELMGALHRDDVDVVVLNWAPPLLAYRAICGSKRIICLDEALRVEIEVRLLQRYLDTKRLRELYYLGMMERLHSSFAGQRAAK